MSDTNERAVIGGNHPPAPTPIEAAREVLADIETEASAWFDGAAVEDDGQADEIARIIDAARKAKARFDADRKTEKQPHLDAGKAVDDAWRPIVASAERIADVAKAALTPWLVAKERAKRDAEERARREAEEKAEAARALARANDGSLAAAEARDVAIEEAARAEARAAAAARDRAGAKGSGMARAVSLRTIWRARIVDRRALLNHVATHDPDGLTAWLEEWASAAIRAGSRSVPGVEACEDRTAA